MANRAPQTSSSVYSQRREILPSGVLHTCGAAAGEPPERRGWLVLMGAAQGIVCRLDGGQGVC
jgi:hypothetical protein